MNKNRIMTTMVIKGLLMAFLIGGLGKMPYDYYQSLRTMGLIAFATLCYQYIASNQYIELIPSLAGLVLFNPVNKITFHKGTWQQIDLWLAVTLGVWAIFDIIKYSVSLKNEREKAKEGES
jgi:hypothetical protein